MIVDDKLVHSGRHNVGSMAGLVSLESVFCQNGFFRSHRLKTIKEQFIFFSKEDLLKKKEEVRTAGRIMRIRNFGRLIFANIMDETATIQLKVDDDQFFSKNVGVGDIIGLTGVICKTNKGELSLQVKNFVLLSKCFKSLPDAHYGFTDIEERFRRRYLDFVINPSSRKILLTRHSLIRFIRSFLDNLGFIEVETPILVSEASGAQAQPFVTYHNKLQRNFYLRIATEIPLKQLLVGGFEKVYEIGKVFRNEGIDARHNPEFTTIEIYQAYENGGHMMNLTENLFSFLIDNYPELKQEKRVNFNSFLIDLSKPFLRVSMIEIVKQYTGIDFSLMKIEQALELAELHKVFLEPFQKRSVGQILITFFETFVEKKIIQPTFVFDYPIEASPLAKRKNNDEKIADRFELFIGGLEFANGYSELNDPFEQKRRFEEQIEQKELGNQEIAFFDEDFVESLEYGMPPAGGLGIGIDRLVMLFTEQNSIKEVIAFPQLKKKMERLKQR